MVTCALGVQLQVFQSHQTFRGSDACFIPTRSCLLGLLLCSFFCPKVTLCSSWGYLLRCSCCQRPLITRFVLKTLDLVEPPVTCFLPRSPVLIMGLDALSGNLQLKNLNIKTSFFFLFFFFSLSLPQFCCPFTPHHSVCTETLWAVCWSSEVYLPVACNPNSPENGNGLWVVHHWVPVFLLGIVESSVWS